MTDYPPERPSPSPPAAFSEAGGGLRPMVVAASDQGARLLPWLRQQLPQAGFSNLNKALRSGQIRLDGKRCTGKERLAVGQLVRVPPFLRAAADTEGMPEKTVGKVGHVGAGGISPREPAMMAAMVIERTPDWLALNKPAGLAVQGGQGVSRHLDRLLPLLAEGGEKLRLVHRLDKETSGLMLVARHVGAASALAQAFRDHDIQKTYWALVWGKPLQSAGSWHASLAKRGTGVEQRMVVDAAGQGAITHYRLLAYNQAANISWLELQPQTGRMHQLRVHCSHAGLPMVGDSKYGARAAVADPNRMGAAELRDGGTGARLLAAEAKREDRMGGGTLGDENPWGVRRGQLYLHAYSLLLPDQSTPLVAPPPPTFTTAVSHLFSGLGVAKTDGG